MDKDYFSFQINRMKVNYPLYKNYQDYHVFTLLCMKYFYFAEDGTAFDYEQALLYLTDGANDGGIDAIFNDPSSENNDIVIVQSKFYQNSKLTADNVAGELYKINETLKKLKANKVQDFREELVTAYRNATSEMEDNGSIKIVFFTSYEPKNKRERNKLDKLMRETFPDFEIEMNFKTDIESQIEVCDNGKLNVDYDKIKIDAKDNYLVYDDSIIVNVSALSLQELQNRRRNALLGRNLRYYVKQMTVDKGIAETIQNEPENFWYKNNGIVIICEDYEIDGREIKLSNFSIINGGQTTNRIGNLDIDKDFYLQCKIVKSKGTTTDQKDKFALDIAKATNSQKPIKKSDLKANTIEQLRLKERLAHHHVYYIIKKGDKAPKQYSEPYQVTTLEKVGKLGLAAVLQMPGSSRSNSQRMYNDEYYYAIFGQNVETGILADLLKISTYYDEFKKHTKGKGYDEKTTLPMINNGKTFQIACIVLLCKINQKVFSYSTIAGYLNNTDDLKTVIRNMGDMKKIILKRFDNEESIFNDIFSTIADEVLSFCYENALDRAEEEQRTLAPSDYLKVDTNYYKDVIKRLWRVYNKSTSNLKKNIDSICNIQE